MRGHLCCGQRSIKDTGISHAIFEDLHAGCRIGTGSNRSMADKLPLGSISSYLNAMTTAKGDFTQINGDGTISTGTIYIKRPGRVRFEYNAPDTGLVIAGSNTVVIYDTKSNQPPETYPLARTPLSIILARNVNLVKPRW